MKLRMVSNLLRNVIQISNIQLEIIGFDDLGRQFDLNGNLKDWWMPETKSKFLNRTKCIIEQYGNFTEPKLEIKVSLSNTNTNNNM